MRKLSRYNLKVGNLSQKSIATIKKRILQSQNVESNEPLDSKQYIKEIRNSKGELVQTNYYLSRNRKLYFVTTLILIAILAIFVFLLLTSSGNYLSAWYLSLSGGVFLLFLMSFPVKVKVKNATVEMHGILDVTPIPIENIRRIYKIDKYRLKHTIPLAASYGFGGYFGYYLDLKKLRLLQLFCTRLDSLLVIEDIYRYRYVLSLPQRDMFIEQIKNNLSESERSSLIDDKVGL